MKTRVLVVDDEEAVRDIIKRLLNLHDYAVDTAADGAEAVDQLQKRRYDLMIIDRMMPKMSGIEAIALVRTSPRFDGLKILMLTGADTTKEVEETFKAGADGYVIKPFEIDRLLEKVKKLLGK